MRNIIYCLTIILLSCMCATANAQRDWEKYFNMISEPEDMEEGSWETVYDILCDIENNPININTASREELEQLPFLTEKDVEGICEYIYRYGEMKTLGELAMIEGLDYGKQQLLRFFLYIGRKEKTSTFPKMRNIMKYGRSDVLMTGKIPFYERNGDKNGYLGYQYKHNVRYNFKYGDYVRFGVVGAQDAGEPFFANKNSLGYDFYSLYLLIKKLGRIKTLAVGQYRVNFGMGLVMNTDFIPGKTAILTSLGRSNSNIRPHSSTQSSNYLQGMAATIDMARNLSASAFVSYRGIDATLNNDTNTIATIVTSGYHRTQSELDKKNNSKQFTAGGNLNYFNKGLHAGVTAIYTSFDKDLQPNTNTLFRRHNATGNNFHNISADYGYTHSQFSINGETAINDKGALATINSISCKLTSELDIMALQRFYSMRYHSLYAQSFSEGGSVQNESGIYLGTNWHPSRKLSVMAYSDYAFFPWPKYQASFASHSWDNMLSVVYAPGEWSFIARYRYKMREKDNEDKTGLIYKREHRGRIGTTYDSGTFNSKTQIDFAYTKYKSNSFGWMISEDIGFSCGKWLKVNGNIGYFNTNDYDSRIYSYERGMLYSLSYPAFYGEGIRYSLLARTEISRRLMLMTKVSTTDYFDRNTIGTEMQQIKGSSLTDLELQLKWKF